MGIYSRCHTFETSAEDAQVTRNYENILGYLHCYKITMNSFPDHLESIPFAKFIFLSSHTALFSYSGILQHPF